MKQILYKLMLFTISLTIFLIVAFAHRVPWWWVSAYWGINVLLNGNALKSNVSVFVMDGDEDDERDTEENQGDTEEL